MLEVPQRFSGVRGKRNQRTPRNNGQLDRTLPGCQWRFLVRLSVFITVNDIIESETQALVQITT